MTLGAQHKFRSRERRSNSSIRKAQAATYRSWVKPEGLICSLFCSSCQQAQLCNCQVGTLCNSQAGGLVSSRRAYVPVKPAADFHCQEHSRSQHGMRNLKKSEATTKQNIGIHTYMYRYMYVFIVFYIYWLERICFAHIQRHSPTSHTDLQSTLSRGLRTHNCFPLRAPCTEHGVWRPNSDQTAPEADASPYMPLDFCGSLIVSLCVRVCACIRKQKGANNRLSVCAVCLD